MRAGPPAGDPQVDDPPFAALGQAAGLSTQQARNLLSQRDEAPPHEGAGRLVSRFPIWKSRVSLMVVSVRSARPCLWYCLIRQCL